jgi:hypothetical protein
VGTLDETRRGPLTEEKADSAQLIAHELMLRMLVSSEKSRNPTFAPEAQKSVDEFLGHLSLDRTTECFVQARAGFAAILNTRTDLFMGPRPQRPTSLRRRFLLWLLRD